MIWNYIRDFLVQYIFGGTDSTGQTFNTYFGKWNAYADGQFDDSWNAYTSDIPFIKFEGAEGYVWYTDLSNWLSTTTTIIIMCVIVFLLALLVRWVYKTVVSAFLLR